MGLGGWGKGNVWHSRVNVTRMSSGRCFPFLGREIMASLK